MSARPIVRPLLLAAMLGPACSAPPAAPISAGPPPGSAMDAGLVYRPGGPARVFTDGRDGAKARLQRREQGPQGLDGRWTITIQARSADKGWSIARTVLLEQAPDGAVRMVEVMDANERTMTRFEPPIALAPPRLLAGEPFTNAARVVVTRLADGAVIERGTAEARAELVGHEPGPPPAFEWTSTLTMRLSAALVTKVSTQSVQDGPGVVAERESLRVTVGPFTVRSSDERWTLIESDQ